MWEAPMSEVASMAFYSTPVGVPSGAAAILRSQMEAMRSRIEAPNDELGVRVPLSAIVLLQNELSAVAVVGIDAFSTGMLLHLTIAFRQQQRPPGRPPFGFGPGASG